MTVRGDGVNVEVVQARIPADRLAPAYVDAKATMDGPWLGALLADRLPAGTRVIDPVQLAVKLEGPLDRLMEEAKGDLDLLSLDFKPGDPYHLSIDDVIRHNLIDGGRFIDYRLTVSSPDEKGVMNLTIAVRELMSAPPLGEELTEVQQLLMKLLEVMGERFRIEPVGFKSMPRLRCRSGCRL